MFSLVIYAFNRNTQHDINRVDVKKNTPKRLYTTYTTSTVDTLNHETSCPMRMLSIRHEKNLPHICHFSKPQKRCLFSKVLCKTIIGCYPNQNSKHSFQIRAATHFAMNSHIDFGR